jgi:hypothetical protein
METFKNEVIIEPFENRAQIATESNMILGLANDWVPIENDKEYQVLGGELARAKKFIKDTEKACRPRIKQVGDLKKSLLDDMNLLVESANKAVPILSGLLVEYDNKQQAKQREEQARIERERIKEEADAREREEKRKLDTATELEKAGKHEEAEAVLNQPDRTIQTPSNIATALMPAKIEGLSYRTTWKAECLETNLDYVDPRFIKKVFDQEMANAYAKSNKEGARARGIRFYSEKIAVNRS